MDKIFSFPKENKTSEKAIEVVESWKGDSYIQPEKEHRIFITNSITEEKIKQFKLGKYTEKYIKTYLDFILLEGIIDNLQYLEYLKEIEEKV